MVQLQTKTLTPCYPSFGGSNFYQEILNLNNTTNIGQNSNIFVNIRKKSKSLLGLSTGARRSCLKKKNRGEKSGGTVPLKLCISLLCFENISKKLKQYYS
jgi:hypothetical protein